MQTRQLGLGILVQHHQFATEDLPAPCILKQCIDADVKPIPALIQPGGANLKKRPMLGIEHLMGETLARLEQTPLQVGWRECAQVIDGKLQWIYM